MATKIHKQTSEKKVIRFKRKARIRSTLSGSAEKPRMAVFKSNQNLYVQLIDDVKGVTLVAASTADKELKGKSRSNLTGAKEVGALIAKRAQAKSITAVVFDRAGYIYHGKIKALADAAREAGLKF
jgi:large subunit ribosomal protein L18